jgi:hypothetical protein
VATPARGRALAVPVLLLATGFLPGQSPDRRPGACAFDTAGARVEVPVIIVLAVPSDVRLSDEARAQALNYARAVARYLEAPDQIPIGFQPTVTTDLGGGYHGSSALGGPLLVPMKTSGRLDNQPPSAGSAFAALNEALVAAVHQVDAGGGLPAFSWAASARYGPVRLGIEVLPEARPGAVPLLRARIPAMRVDTDVAPDRLPRPVYPPEAGQRGEGASIDLRYLVLENGSVDPGSIDVLSVVVDGSNTPALSARPFVASAVRALTRARFHPAVAQGCPVAATVRQRFTFHIGGRPR